MHLLSLNPSPPKVPDSHFALLPYSQILFRSSTPPHVVDLFSEQLDNVIPLCFLLMIYNPVFTSSVFSINFSLFKYLR